MKPSVGCDLWKRATANDYVMENYWQLDSHLAIYLYSSGWAQRRRRWREAVVVPLSSKPVPPQSVTSRRALVSVAFCVSIKTQNYYSCTLQQKEFVHVILLFRQKKLVNVGEIVKTISLTFRYGFWSRFPCSRLLSVNVKWI